MAPAELHLLLRSDRDEAVLTPGEKATIEGDVEQAFLPVRCGSCGETAILEGHQRGLADEDMTATAHAGECPSCGDGMRAEVTYLHDRYRGEWQPLANPDVEGGEAVDVEDMAERVP